MTKRISWSFAAIALSLVSLAGCKKPGRSVVQIHMITTDDPALMASLTRVEIVVSRGTTELRRVPLNWPPPVDVGVYLSADVEGMVTVRGVGFSGTDQNAIAEKRDVVVAPGEASAPISLILVAGTDTPPTGGTGGASGSGGRSGTGGASGTGGSAGTGSPGTGGSLATGGATATGGTVGTGGMAGTVGSGGRGGVAGGTGGRAGGAGGAGGHVWGGALRPDPNSLVTELSPQVAVDAQGNAVVVYVHGSAIWANHYSFATNVWGTASAIDARTGGGTAPQSPAVAVATVAGAAQWMAVWQQDYSSPTLHGIWQSTSSDGITWSAPAAITTAGQTFDPVLAMNRTGTAVVAWEDTTNAQFTLMASVRPAGGTWTTPRVMHLARDSGDRIPAVAVAGQGDVFVAWEQADDGVADQISVWTDRWTATTGWAAEMLMESYDAYGAYATGIAANQSGQAVLTWLQPTQTTQTLWARKYAPGTGWAAGVMIVDAEDIPWFPSPTVVLDDAGVSTVAFAVTSGTPGRSNAYTVRAGWTQAWPAPIPLETDNLAPIDAATLVERAPSPIVSIDAAGNGVVVWRKQMVGTRFDLYGRQVTGAGVWGAPTLLGSQDPNSVFFPALSVGVNGTGAVVWYYGNELRVWANVLR
jgi:hypothetical protein